MNINDIQPNENLKLMEVNNTNSQTKNSEDFSAYVQINNNL